MQDLISQVEDLAGIEIDHTTSMVMIFGIIFLTAVVVHIILQALLQIVGGDKLIIPFC